MIHKLLDEFRRAFEWLFAHRDGDSDGEWYDDRWREDYDAEPIRGRVWDAEDVEDMGGIDDGWPGD